MMKSHTMMRKATIKVGVRPMCKASIASVGRTSCKPMPIGVAPLTQRKAARNIRARAIESHLNVLYTLADATEEAVNLASKPEVVEATAAAKKSGFFNFFANILETFLKIIDSGLEQLHVPYSYGFSIILLTMLVKLATFPLSKKQVESSMQMQSLQPRIKELQEKFANDQERLQLETAKLYKDADVQPLAGCLPTFISLPIWIGLYRGLTNAAEEGLLTDGFYWIPSLSGPTTIAARQAGTGLTWLFPFENGAPPVGWHDASAYLVLPALLIVSQYISQQILSSQQPQQQGSAQVILKALPLMIGWFSLNVPSGLTLYWFTNNILSVGQTVWLRQSFQPPEIADMSTSAVDRVERVSAVKEMPKISAPQGRSGEKFWELKQKEMDTNKAILPEIVSNEQNSASGSKFWELKQEEELRKTAVVAEEKVVEAPKEEAVEESAQIEEKTVEPEPVVSSQPEPIVKSKSENGQAAAKAKKSSAFKKKSKQSQQRRKRTTK